MICDNARFHDLQVSEYLEVGGPDRGASAAGLRAGNEPDRAGVVAPAREHHAESSVPDLGELLDQVFAWLGQENPFQIEGSVYPKAKAA